MASHEGGEGGLRRTGQRMKRGTPRAAASAPGELSLPPSAASAATAATISHTVLQPPVCGSPARWCWSVVARCLWRCVCVCVCAGEHCIGPGPGTGPTGGGQARVAGVMMYSTAQYSTYCTALARAPRSTSTAADAAGSICKARLLCVTGVVVVVVSSFSGPC